MKASSAPSPWPAPTLDDLVLADEVQPLPVTLQPGEPAGTHPTRHAVTALLSTAKRLSSRTERAEHAAAKEEQRIGLELDDLPAGWFVLHSLDIEPESDARHVDHIAIGPGGMFIIYVEHQPGAKVWISEHTVTINGRDSDHLRQARFEARRASGRLTDACGRDVTVQSVLMLIARRRCKLSAGRPKCMCGRSTTSATGSAAAGAPGRRTFAVYDHLRPAEVSPSPVLSGLPG